MEKGKIEHHRSHCQGHKDPVPKRLFRPVVFACAHILRHKGGHGLHEGHRHQHDKGADLFRDADAGGGSHAEGIDDHLDQQEGDPDQEVLQGDGQADAGDPADHVAVESDLRSLKLKRQFLFPDQQKGNKDTDCLCENGGDGRSGGSHAETRHQQKISRDIEDTGDRHCEKRRH